MFRQDALEAVPIVDAVLASVLAVVPTSGISGSTLRTNINQARVNAETLLIGDQIGPPLESIFRLAATIATFAQMELVRQTASAQTAVSAGAILVRDSLVQYALATEGVILSGTTFTSRDDVENIRPVINNAFQEAEELAADSHDSTTYQQLIGLHAAISYFLTQTAQPLPRMLNFYFAVPSIPTLVAAYKLYADASRADELRDQNHVVHPAFMPPTGRALSA